MHFPGYSLTPVLFTPDGHGFIAEKGGNLYRVDFPLQIERTHARPTGTASRRWRFRPTAPCWHPSAKIGPHAYPRWTTARRSPWAIFPISRPAWRLPLTAASRSSGASLEIADKKTIGQIARWDIKTGKLLDPWLGHRGKVTALAVSPKHFLLASASSDAVKIWDLRAGREVAQLDPENGRQRARAGLASHGKIARRGGRHESGQALGFERNSLQGHQHRFSAWHPADGLHRQR